MKALLILAVVWFSCLPEPKVYICRSGTSYAYHNRLCQGLNRCTHKIDTVTVKEAVEKGHGKPCGYCYKK